MMDGLSVLGLIPARGGSKGIPGKNLRPVAGRALIEWTIEAGLGSALIDRLVLSSDDEAIMAAARAAGCETPFRRDPALATDEAASIDVVIDALDRLPGHDVVVLLQPTSPLRTAADIDAALRLLADTGAPSCVSVCEAADHPWLSFIETEGLLAAACAPPPGASLRRQDLPPARVLNGAIYAARVDAVRAERRLFHPGRSVALLMPRDRSLDIDDWDDLKAADARLSRQDG